MFTYRDKIIKCSSLFEEEDDGKPEEPLKKVTLEDVIATFPPDYEEVIGKVILIDKTHDENEIVDIDLSSNHSINSSTVDNFLPNPYANAKENVKLDKRKHNSELKISGVKHLDDNDETNDKDVLEESDSEFEMQDASENKVKVKDLNDDNDDDDDVTDVSSNKDDEKSDDQGDEKSSQADTSGSKEDDFIRNEYKKKLKEMVKEQKNKEGHIAKECGLKSKPKFSKREQKIMLYYLIVNNAISVAKGKQVWTQFHNDGYLPHRSEQSTWNHLMQTMLPSIEKLIREFKLPKFIVRKFQKLRLITPRRRS